VPSRDQSPATGQKRRANSESEENRKSKNVRNNFRGSAGASPPCAPERGYPGLSVLGIC
jgi:hypothetical protein